MTFVLAGLTASGIAWLLNGLMLDKAGRWWIIALGPFFEEFAKTGAALLLSTNIFFCHFTFGVVEAIRDMSGGQPGNFWAAWASLTGHGLFGFLAALSYQRTGEFWLAIIIPFTVHLLWNGGVLLLRSCLTGHR